MAALLMEEIRRTKLNAVEVDGAVTGLASLAESAKALLGYDVLSKRVATVAVQQETELRTVLAALEIDILDERDVIRYQKERLIERTAELMQEWVERTVKQEFSDCAENGYNAFGGPNWRLMKIEEYKQPIPEHVLAKAVQIKERLPECAIYVEHLEDHPDPFLLVGAAPAKYSWCRPEEHYYVEVWAEPKFESVQRW